MEVFQDTTLGRRATAMLKVTMAMYKCQELCCAVMERDAHHAALICAVLYCIVDQVVLGASIPTELIWILSSSCLNA